MRFSVLGRAPAGNGESVPVAEQLRVMQWLRATAVALLLGAAFGAPSVLQPRDGLREQAVQVTIAYAVLVLVGEGLRRMVPKRTVAVCSALLGLDGVWLACTWFLTGQQGSPVQFLVLLHLGAVALLASYRTSVQLALWHTVLLYAAFNSAGLGLFTAEVAPGNGSA